VSIQLIPYLHSVVTVTPAIVVLYGKGACLFSVCIQPALVALPEMAKLNPYLTYEAEVSAVVPVDVSACYREKQQAKLV
jgi:hypothetical protein